MDDHSKPFSLSILHESNNSNSDVNECSTVEHRTKQPEFADQVHESLMHFVKPHEILYNLMKSKGSGIC